MEFEAQIDRVASNLEFERSRDTQSKLLCLSLITFHNILIDIVFNVGGVVSIVNSKIWRTYGIVIPIPGIEHAMHPEFATQWGTYPAV